MWTPYGRCFLLNSLQNNHPKSEHWLPASVNRYDNTELKLIVNQSVRVDILNEEDMPNPALPSVNFVSILGKKKTIKFFTEALINDPEIKEISPEARDCYFPDEVPSWSVHKAYSFSACISDCTRLAQYDKCNCSLFIFNPFNDERYPDCDFDGLLCLERHGMVKPNIAWMMKYRHPVANCDCLPACTESNIEAIYSNENIE